jgi:hypothetical protein
MIAWNACISMTEGIAPTTPGMGITPVSKTNTRVFPPPEPKTYNLPDGCIRIELGSFWKIVSSYHLIDAAIHQLERAYRDSHTN